MTIGSEPYTPENLLDRVSRAETLEFQYAQMHRREQALVRRHVGIDRGDVLSVGAGWHPGRHLFPSPAFRLTAIDADPAKVAGVLETRRADAAHVGLAGQLELPPRVVRRRSLPARAASHRLPRLARPVLQRGGGAVAARWRADRDRAGPLAPGGLRPRRSPTRPAWRPGSTAPRMTSPSPRAS